MEYNTLKEKDTWILGTGLFIGYMIGIILGNFIDYEPDLLMRIILGIVLYFSTISLVALIKYLDRLTLSLREDE
jgi:uncharacterized membrane protein YfcA